MFETYVVAKTENPRKWLFGTTIGSVIAFMLGFVGLVAYSFWKIEKLQPKYVPVSFVAMTAPPPPPPPPPPPAAPKHATVKVETKKVVIKEIVQPVKVEEKKVEEEPKKEEESTDKGEEGGVAGGVEGGVAGGVVGSNGPPAPAPPPPEKPQIVSLNAIQGLRVAGNADIHLPSDILQVMSKQGIKKATVIVKLCLNASGAPTSIDFARRSGYAEADANIEQQMREWRYRPYTVNGAPIPVCTAVVFNYQIE